MNSAQETNPSAAYAGPQEEKSYSLVLFYGLASTALALFGVYLLDRTTTRFPYHGLVRQLRSAHRSIHSRYRGFQRLRFGVVVQRDQNYSRVALARPGSSITGL